MTHIFVDMFEILAKIQGRSYYRRILQDTAGYCPGYRRIVQDSFITYYTLYFIINYY